MYGEPIKIQVGRIFMNKTRKYLFPIIKEHGSDFTAKINALFKVAVGIGDMIVDKCGIHHENHLFILVDTLVNTPQFVSLMDDIRRHPAYEDDYVYGNVSKSRFHMIIIKVPDKYLNTLSNFKQSKFSKMYTQEELNTLFRFNTAEMTEENSNIKSVLIKDHNYKFAFARMVQKEFNIPKSEFTSEDIDDSFELDLTISETEEKFNFKTTLRNEKN